MAKYVNFIIILLKTLYNFHVSKPTNFAAVDIIQLKNQMFEVGKGIEKITFF